MCTCFPSTHVIVSSEKCKLISSFILFPVKAQYNAVIMCHCFPEKYVLMLISNFTWFPVSISASLYVYQISPSTKMSRASLFAGTFSLAVCIYVWVVIAFFLTENQFNPIQDALDDFFPKLEAFLQDNATFQGENFNATAEDLRNYVENIRAFCPDVITATLGISVVYALSAIVMMIATEFQFSRVLMVPYMVLQLFFIIIMIHNSFFQNLTMVVMPHYSSASSLGSFMMFILIVLASMALIYLGKWVIGVMFINYVLVVICLPHLPMAFSGAYFGWILNSIASLHIPFAACLMLVWKVFEKEPKNTK